jgi:hypothetical protein
MTLFGVPAENYQKEYRGRHASRSQRRQCGFANQQLSAFLLTNVHRGAVVARVMTISE